MLAWGRLCSKVPPCTNLAIGLGRKFKRLAPVFSPNSSVGRLRTVSGGTIAAPKMLPESNYQPEREVAVAAVLQACIITQRIFDKLIRPQLQTDRATDTATITKIDRSPVTVGDYTVQALVTFIISKFFPNDEIVGEEDSSELVNATDKKHLKQITEFTNQAIKQDQLCTLADEEIWKPYRNQDGLGENELLKLIDLGNSQGGNEGRNRRFWTLDPIDGTKGFLRGGQYAVCLALIINGEVALGVVGTPNLPLHGPPGPNNNEPAGTLFLAQKGSGAFQRALNADNYTQIHMTPRTPETLAQSGTFCESFESAHSDQTFAADIANELKMANYQKPIRIDSQAKYCALSRGDSDVYLRLPTKPDYQEKIWDHAAGNILITESGGKVTDLNGKSLDFSCGRTLSGNHQGFLACHADIFDFVLSSVQKVAKSHHKL